MAKTAPRPVRLCDTCHGVDDAPRHSHAVAPGGNRRDRDFHAALMNAAADDDARADLSQQWADDAVVVKHMDCCAADGCPTGACDEVLAGAGDRRDADLVRYLTKGK